MNVVVVTTKEESYHQYLSAEIARRYDAVAVLHPRRRHVSLRERVRVARKRIRYHGWPHFVLWKLCEKGLASRVWDARADLDLASRRLIPDAAAAYDKYAAPVARDVDDINSAAGVALLRSFEPDVVVCSGGPIYQAPLIEAAGLMLNFHTGVSPIYNGSWTIYWTYANRQPHVTGGTLMKMSPRVDGGDVLGHYLPAVEPGDTPGVQFIKTIMGGVAMYGRFLDDLRQRKPYAAVPQGAPFRFFRGIEWTPYQWLTIQRHIDSDICREFVRPERVHDYWRLADDRAAAAALRDVVSTVVCNG